jgi:hypothetical protein
MSSYLNNKYISSAKQYVASGNLMYDSAETVKSAMNSLTALFSLASTINNKFNTKDNRNKLLEFIKSFFIQIGNDLSTFKNRIRGNSDMSADQQTLAEKFIDGIFNLLVLIAIVFGAGGILKKGGKSKTIKHKSRKHKKTRRLY